MLSLGAVPMHGQKLTDFAISKSSTGKPVFFFTNEKGEVYHSKRSGAGPDSDSVFPKQPTASAVSEDLPGRLDSLLGGVANLLSE